MDMNTLAAVAVSLAIGATPLVVASVAPTVAHDNAASQEAPVLVERDHPSPAQPETPRRVGEGSRGQGATEFIRFSVGEVVWGATDGMPGSLAQHHRYRATIHVLVTAALRNPVVRVQGHGLRVTDCSGVRLTRGVVATFTCTVEVARDVHNGLSLRALVRASDHEYATSWSHADA